MEVLIALTIIALSASIAIPTFQKTQETSYWRSAQDILQTIYTGEQVYKAQSGTYLNVGVGTGNWATIYMDDPNGANPLPAQFTAVTGGAGTSFTARAFRGTTAGPCMCMTDVGGRAVFFTQAACGCASGIGWAKP